MLALSGCLSQGFFPQVQWCKWNSRRCTLKSPFSLLSLISFSVRLFAVHTVFKIDEIFLMNVGYFEKIFFIASISHLVHSVFAWGRKPGKCCCCYKFNFVFFLFNSGQFPWSRFSFFVCKGQITLGLVAPNYYLWKYCTRSRVWGWGWRCKKTN